MIGLIVIACALAASGRCDPTSTRVDVLDLVWSTPIGCVIATPQVVAQWSAANPGYRIVTTKCVPEARLRAVVAEIEEGV